MGAEPVDTSAAEAFEKFLVPTIFGPWSQVLVDHAGVTAGDRVLDIGCGTGVAARYAAGLVCDGGKVVATDINAGMIAWARQLDTAGAVEWRLDSVEDLPNDDASFDAVIGNQVLQFLPDKPKALAEMRRVLTANGRLALTVYCQIDLCPAHAAVAKALAPPPVAAEWLLPLVAPGGLAVLFVGASVDLAAIAGVAARLAAEPVEARAGLVVLRKVGPTPPGFPRRPGVARKRPLA